MYTSTYRDYLAAGEYAEPRNPIEAQVFEIFNAMTWTEHEKDIDQDYLHGVLEKLLIENKDLKAQLQQQRRQKAA